MSMSVFSSTVVLTILFSTADLDGVLVRSSSLRMPVEAYFLRGIQML